MRWETPRYNIAPTQNVEAIISDGMEKRLGPMRWGFVSASAKDPKLAPINARCETVATTPMFRDAFRRRRCLVVADGFYEWRKNGQRKTPYFIHLRSSRPFAFAGIWSFQRAAVGRLFPMYHCGARILNTHRKYAQQERDWSRVRKALMR